MEEGWQNAQFLESSIAIFFIWAFILIVYYWGSVCGAPSTYFSGETDYEGWSGMVAFCTWEEVRDLDNAYYSYS